MQDQHIMHHSTFRIAITYKTKCGEQYTNFVYSSDPAIAELWTDPAHRGNAKDFYRRLGNRKILSIRHAEMIEVSMETLEEGNDEEEPERLVA